LLGGLLGGLYFVLGCLQTIVIIVAGMAVVAVAISAAEIFG